MTAPDSHHGGWQYEDPQTAPGAGPPGLPGRPPAAALASGARLDIDGERVRNGLAQLVLTLVKLLHELLERQAIARMDSGSLSEEDIERLGTTLMRQAEELRRVQEVFGLDDEDLNIDLGPLGRLL